MFRNPQENDAVNTLKERLAWARKKKGLTQKRLAELANIDQANISVIETGKGSGTSHLPKLAAILGVDALWLQTGEGTPVESVILNMKPDQLIEAAKAADLPKEKIAELVQILAARLSE